MAHPIILTATFGDGDNGWLQQLRRDHYPAELNRVPAHLTLFHQLPPSLERELGQRVAGHAARAAPRVREEVLAFRTPALLARPGLVARYDLMDMLAAFSQASGAAGGPPSLWLLIPQAGPALPQIDGPSSPLSPPRTGRG